MFSVHGNDNFISLGIFEQHSANTYLLRWEIGGEGPLVPATASRRTGWHEFKIVTDGSNASLFIDGAKQIEVPGIGSFNAISFGDGWEAEGAETFVDDVRVIATK